MKTYAFATILISQLVFAAPQHTPAADPTPIPISSEDAAGICTSDQATIVQRTNLKVVPNYFAKLYATRNVATLIAADSTYAFNLDSGRLTEIDAGYDPVPSPDETFLVAIEYSPAGSENGPHYFLSENLLDHPKPEGGYVSWQPGEFDMSYAYQSLGWLPNAAAGKYTYRFLCDDDNGTVFFRDDSFKSTDAGQALKSYHLTAGNWVKACSNLDSTFKLPMVSKDGKQIAVFNTDQNVTQIFDLTDTGECTNGRNLPFITGKADFSFDGNQVAFHMGRIAEPREWFKTVNPARKIDTFVWDLQSKRLTRLTDVESGNAYFPTFKKDGKVGFLLQTLKSPQSEDADNAKYSYVISNPSHGIALDQFPDLADKCNCKLDGFAEIAAVGILKDTVCKSFHSTYSLEDESALALTLTNQHCQTLVSKYWPSYKAKVLKEIASMDATNDHRRDLVVARLKSIDLASILGACSETQSHAVETKVVDSKDHVAMNTDPSHRLQVTCSQCHTGTRPASGLIFDLANVPQMPQDLRAKMAEQIKLGNMPPGGLNVSERATLVAYLLKPTN